MKKFLILISIVAASMFSTVSAAVGNVTTIVDQDFTGSPTLTDKEDSYSWGKELTIETNGDCNQTGVILTNRDNADNNYESKDFITFSKPLGSSTQELNISYDIVQSKGKGQTMTYCGINYYNENGKFVFGIKEGSGENGWQYSSELVTIDEKGDKSTIVLPNKHIGGGTGSTVNLTVKFSGTKVIIEVDGASYNSYSESEGIKSIKLSVDGGRDYNRYLIIKKFKVETTEVAAAQFADYTVKYECDGKTIKEDTKSGIVGSEISLIATETADFTEGDIKYLYVSDNAKGKTVDAEGTTVVTITFREAAKYKWTVKANVDDIVIATGDVFEGESANNIPFSRYIIDKNNVVWMKSVGTDGKQPYTTSFKPNIDGDENTIDYTKTDMTDGIFFKEAEDFSEEEGWTKVNGARNTGGRASNANGAYATNGSATLYKLKPGTYNFKFATICDGGYNTLILKAGDLEILSGAANTYLQEYSTNKAVTISSETDLTIEGTNNRNVLDYILITGVEMEPEDPWVASYPKTWNFTNWSEATVANLQTGSNWTDDEKDNGTTVDGCFWQVSTAKDLSINRYVKANGVSIEELKGLVYTNTTNDRSLAIAVNYPETNLGTYNGASYLWLGGSEINYFKIPRVPAGATIKIGVESHKNSDARGVELSIDGTVLTAPDGSAVAAPTTYVEQEWFVPMTAAATNDVQIKNTNGCHIYFITVT
ncbi:MAG: hypothetical protein K2O47_07355, partial [Muribaculaceae bacterium]|nr:hypothetical protein [Muribaculaceae bacterium]